jgi:hypothetical protein
VRVRSTRLGFVLGCSRIGGSSEPWFRFHFNQAANAPSHLVAPASLPAIRAYAGAPHGAFPCGILGYLSGVFNLAQDPQNAEGAPGSGLWNLGLGVVFSGRRPAIGIPLFRQQSEI